MCVSVCVCAWCEVLEPASRAARLLERHQGDLQRSSLTLRVSDSEVLREQTRLDANAEDMSAGGTAEECHCGSF